MINSDKRIVIVGGGSAGLSAAIEASNNDTSNSTIILIEKCNRIGGNSQKASSGINGCKTVTQQINSITDNFDTFKEDILRVGSYNNNNILVEKLIDESSKAIDFLITIGLPIGELIQCGGHSIPRTHRLSTKAPIGFTLVKTLSSHITDKHPNIVIRTSTQVSSLLWEVNDKGERFIKGVTVQDINSDSSSSTELEIIPANAVIITTGGAAFDRADDGLMAEFSPQLKGMASSSGPQADGHGVKIARQAGAALVNMDKVQVHPTGFIDPNNPENVSKFLAPEALRGSGGIMINQQGKRFANELGKRSYITEQINTNCEVYDIKLSSGIEQRASYLLLTESAVNTYGSDAMNFYLSKGLFKLYESPDAFSQSTGVPIDNLTDTLKRYSHMSDEVDEFGKVTFPQAATFIDSATSSGPKLWVAIVTPVIHYSLGGLKIDANAAVQWLKDKNDNIFYGLYAAGECTGGVHGFDRLAGNSLLECIVFGRTAGVSAAHYVSNN